jgi:hypothetical protein
VCGAASIGLKLLEILNEGMGFGMVSSAFGDHLGKNWYVKDFGVAWENCGKSDLFP